MKLNDVKHNHSLTDLLKILLFSILMMIPFIDVGVRCAYVVCNKNAYQSYSDNSLSKEYIENQNDFVVNDTYYFSSYTTNGTVTETVIGSFNQRIYFDNINVLSNNTNTDISTAKSMGFYKNSTNNVISGQLFDENNNLVVGFNSNSVVTFSFSYLSSGLNDYFIDLDMFYKTYQTNYLDNVFDYSVNKLTTSELYTWTQQTAIYTGVQTMCAQLGINNTVIPILFVYWFILTVIYIIVDIVIKLFTLLTHSIGSKTA